VNAFSTPMNVNIPGNTARFYQIPITPLTRGVPGMVRTLRCSSSERTTRTPEAGLYQAVEPPFEPASDPQIPLMRQNAKRSS